MFINENVLDVVYPESVLREIEKLEKIGISSHHLILKSGIDNDNDSVEYTVQTPNQILVNFNHVVFIEPIYLPKQNKFPLTFLGLTNNETVILDIIFKKFIEKYNLLGGH